LITVLSTNKTTTSIKWCIALHKHKDTCTVADQFVLTVQLKELHIQGPAVPMQLLMLTIVTSESPSDLVDELFIDSQTHVSESSKSTL